MKQRRFGQKVQNWHRPLGPNELRARYLRLRDSPSGIVTVGGISQEPPEFDHGDGDYFYQDYYADEVSHWDIQRQKHSSLVWTACYPHHPFHTLGSFFPLEAPAPPLIDCPPSKFTTLLAEHLARVNDYDSNEPELIESIQKALGYDDAQNTIRHHLPELADALCLFAPFWYRSPQTWEPESGCSLLEHLFVLYPIPPFLLQTLQDSIRQRDYKWLCWLILLGRSISLKSAAHAFGWNVPGKLPHYLMQTPAGIWHPVVGIIYAEVLRLGGTERDFRRIVADASFQIDFTDPDVSERECLFWRETVCWLIAHGNELTEADCPRILAWARHSQTEARRRRREVFRWVGRSVRAVREQAEAYEAEQYAWLTSGYQHYSWAPQGWDWAEENSWSITELLSSTHLAEEGAAMRHCVAGYAWRCYAGTSAIFSVRYKGERHVTMELCPHTKTLRQIHGLYNRDPTAEEQGVVLHWHRTVVTPPG